MIGLSIVMTSVMSTADAKDTCEQQVTNATVPIQTAISKFVKKCQELCKLSKENKTNCVSECGTFFFSHLTI